MGEAESRPYLMAFDLSAPRQASRRALRLTYELTPGSEGWRRLSGLQVRMSVWLLPDGPGPAHPLPLLDSVVASKASPGCYLATVSHEAVSAGLARLGVSSPSTFSLAHLFHRELRVLLELCDGEAVLARDETRVELYDTGQLGSLYRRLMERLVASDTAAQGARRGLGRLPARFHPWYPVLTIGMDKARLYLKAIESDAAQHTAHLPDPRWLMRVGLYLELLTCLGIIEAVRAEYPELLTPEERHALESTPALASLREHLDVKAWREVWGLRHMARSSPWRRARPSGRGNLLRKQRATLAFLEAHHEDLKQAIRLAGPAREGGRRRGGGCSSMPSARCSATPRRCSRSSRPCPLRCGPSRSGTSAGTSGRWASAACHGGSAGCWEIRMGCSPRPAGSTGSR